MNETVLLTEPQEGVVQITMQDHRSRNSFSRELMAGLKDAFQRVAGNPRYRVVVLTGYENYFCCGGTKEELVAIHKGELNFNDLQFFTLPLDCALPVVSAMQGHALGGGLVFGLYADHTILGRENIYTANFMKYGFTPGMGATLMVPLRMGEVVGNEMLFSAENYRGGELKERGVPLKVVPKAEVLKEALRLAACLAEKPRLSLVTLKEHLTADIRSRLPGIIQKELAMHGITFPQQEVAERIHSFFTDKEKQAG